MGNTIITIGFHKFWDTNLSSLLQNLPIRSTIPNSSSNILFDHKMSPKEQNTHHKPLAKLSQAPSSLPLVKAKGS